MNVVIIIDKKEAKQSIKNSIDEPRFLPSFVPLYTETIPSVTLIQIYLISRFLISKHNGN